MARPPFRLKNFRNTNFGILDILAKVRFLSAFVV